MDEIAAPPATQMRPFPPIRCIGRRRAGGSECEQISFADASESNGHRGGQREGLGKHFLSEVIDPGRQGGRKAERDAGNDSFTKPPNHLQTVETLKRLTGDHGEDLLPSWL